MNAFRGMLSVLDVRSEMQEIVKITKMANMKVYVNLKNCIK